MTIRIDPWDVELATRHASERRQLEAFKVGHAALRPIAEKWGTPDPGYSERHIQRAFNIGWAIGFGTVDAVYLDFFLRKEDRFSEVEPLLAEVLEHPTLHCGEPREESCEIRKFRGWLMTASGLKYPARFGVVGARLLVRAWFPDDSLYCRVVETGEVEAKKKVVCEGIAA